MGPPNRTSMAPVKFDDLQKTAKDVLSEDYQEKGHIFKSKMKTNFEGLSDCGFTGDGGKKEGATVTTAIDFVFGSPCATPAKLTFKFPKPLGLKGFAIDKFEMDKSGGKKLECSVDAALHTVKDLKVECKSDLTGLDSAKLAFSYTGIAGLLAKAEFNATSPAKYMVEASYALGNGLTVGARTTPKSPLDAGAQYITGPLFFSAYAQENFGLFNLHGHFKARDDLQLACNYTKGGKNDGYFAAGAHYQVMEGCLLKGKLEQAKGGEFSVSSSIKKTLAKGASVTASTKTPLSGAGGTWGMHFNVE